MAGSILSGSQDVTRGRVQTLDWRPREAEKDLSGEAPERLGGQERWGQKRNRFSASSGCTNVHQTLCSEADSKGPPRKFTLHRGRIAFPTTNGVGIRKGPCRLDLI
jgi:hypothetical protein